MNGFGQTADKKRTTSFMKSGSNARSIFEALQGAYGTSIFEMLREPHGGNSIFEDLRAARALNLGNDKEEKESILQVDWKKRE